MMKMIEVRFPDRESSSKGISKVMRRGPVVCLPDNTFVVPAPALAVFDELGLTYDVLSEEGVNHVVHTLRSTAPTKVQ